MKRALITGITGMDGSHLADFLLDKGYEVFGMERRTSTKNRVNTSHLENKITFLKMLNIITHWKRHSLGRQIQIIFIL